MLRALGASANPLPRALRSDRNGGGTNARHPDFDCKSTIRPKGIRNVKLYRINKVTKPGGIVLKKKHVLAANDGDAVRQAAASPDCPICDVHRDGTYIASIT
jgi:hypothetical protein